MKYTQWFVAQDKSRSTDGAFGSYGVASKSAAVPYGCVERSP